MRVEFSVTGSAAEPYNVVFSSSGGRLTATCTCQAGLLRQACKHRLDLLAGDVSALASGNSHEVELLRTALAGTPLANAMAQLGEAERELEKAKRIVAAAKKGVSRTMHDATAPMPEMSAA